ncbi:hypothetical protein [uncultured Rhodoblastus sp.]|uniref:hypothetical protein n=1 Tax=uncultured Rhodoblastus sp. TaxID=543037 RepID=UPI0025E5D2C2|nr:hypothetical protein [uncultured Rhodoblastus sp.]
MPDASNADSTTPPTPHRAADPRQDLHILIDLVREMDHGQNAQLEATGLLREEVGALQGLLAHLIQILTPQQSEDEGESLRDLLSRVIAHQRELARLLKVNLATSGRIETRLGGAPTPPKTSAVF